MCPCPCCQQVERRRRFRPIAFLFQFIVLYMMLVLGGGTLINTGHPVAEEAGRLLQTVTLVDPAIQWADSHGLNPVAGGLRLAAGGLRVHKLIGG